MDNREALEKAQRAIRRISEQENDMFRRFCSLNYNNKGATDKRAQENHLIQSVLTACLYELESEFKGVTL